MGELFIGGNMETYLKNTFLTMKHRPVFNGMYVREKRSWHFSMRFN